MAATPANTVEVDPKLLERAQKAADERGLAVPQLVNTALEHELGNEAPQPPFLLIGAFNAGRSDLSARASRDARTRGRPGHGRGVRREGASIGPGGVRATWG